VSCLYLSAARKDARSRAGESEKTVLDSLIKISCDGKHALEGLHKLDSFVTLLIPLHRKPKE
jgi:hypothetical protein